MFKGSRLIEYEVFRISSYRTTEILAYASTKRDAHTNNVLFIGTGLYQEAITWKLFAYPVTYSMAVLLFRNVLNCLSGNNIYVY